MGYMRHHAIIVSSWKEEHIVLAHNKAKEIFGTLVTEILPEVVNGYRSFFIGTDGSKEGWAQSSEGDLRREIFKKCVRESKLYLDVAEVQYADEDGVLWVKAVPE